MKKLIPLITSVFLVACGGGSSNSAPAPGSNSSSSVSSGAANSHKVTVYDSVDGRKVINKIIVGGTGVASITPLSPFLNKVSYETNCNVVVSEKNGDFEFEISAVKQDCNFYVTYESSLPESHVVQVIASNGNTGGTIREGKYSVQNGKSLSIPYTINSGYRFDVNGCNGIADDDAYIIPAVTSDCVLITDFHPTSSNLQVVAVSHSKGGKVWPTFTKVETGKSITIHTEPSYGLKPALTQASDCGYIAENQDNSFTVESVNTQCELQIEFKQINSSDHLVNVKVPESAGLVPTTLDIGNTVKAPIHNVFAVSEKTPFSINIGGSNNNEVTGVEGCQVFIEGDLAKIAVQSITDNCDLNINTVRAVQTQTARYMNITADVVPAQYGEFITDKIKVHAGTGTQLIIETHPNYEIGSVTGCDGIQLDNLNDAVTLVTTGAIEKQCHITANLIKSEFQKPAKPLLIAHAGGGYKNQGYLNSLEALNVNYALGHRYFEVDLNWTSDNELVAIHDWDGTFRRLFSKADHAVVPDLKTFMGLAMMGNQTQVSLTMLNQWLIDHPEAYIVTDIKENNVAALTKVKAQLGDNYQRFIPQIYEAEEYTTLRKLGYQNIIFTLYVTHASTAEIIYSIQNLNLFAVTISPYRGDFQQVVNSSKQAGKYVYVHTFNELSDFTKYNDLGVDGLYTDYLYPKADGSIGKQ